MKAKAVVKPSERILEIMRIDTCIPKGYQASPMDYIRYIMQYLDEQAVNSNETH